MIASNTLEPHRNVKAPKVVKVAIQYSNKVKVNYFDYLNYLNYLNYLIFIFNFLNFKHSKGCFT